MTDLCGVTDTNFVACSLHHGHLAKHKFDRIVEYGTDEERGHIAAAIRCLDDALLERDKPRYTRRMIRVAQTYLDALLNPRKR